MDTTHDQIAGRKTEQERCHRRCTFIPQNAASKRTLCCDGVLLRVFPAPFQKSHCCHPLSAALLTVCYTATVPSLLRRCSAQPLQLVLRITQLRLEEIGLCLEVVSLHLKLPRLVLPEFDLARLFFQQTMLLFDGGQLSPQVVVRLRELATILLKAF